jgi:hypothetical protein
MGGIVFDGEVERLVLPGLEPMFRSPGILGDPGRNLFAQRADGGEQDGAILDAITLVASDLVSADVTGDAKVHRQRGKILDSFPPNFQCSA